MKNLFIIIALLFFILDKGYSQVVAGSASLQINGVQIKPHDKYTHPVANQNIVLGADIFQPSWGIDMSTIGCYIYKNGSVIATNSSPNTSTLNYSLVPILYQNGIPIECYLTVNISCSDIAYGSGNYWVNCQYKFSNIYDGGNYWTSVTTPAGTVDDIAATANVCGNYAGNASMSAYTITSCTTANLQSGSHTTLAANQSVVFSPGFSASSGSNMHAFINNGCISSANMARVASSLTNDEVQEPTSNKVYPNPTTGILNIPISYSKNSSYIFIYNSLGEEIYSQSISSDNNSLEVVNINLSNYASGVYTLKVTSDNNTLVQKIILEK